MPKESTAEAQRAQRPGGEPFRRVPNTPVSPETPDLGATIAPVGTGRYRRMARPSQ